MDDRTPVLIGAGQFTYRGEPQSAPAPTRLLKIAALGAAQDAGLTERDLAALDSLAVVGFTVDAPGGGRATPHSTNPPLSLARALGATPAWSVYSHMGGNSPQQLINSAAWGLAKGLECGSGRGSKANGIPGRCILRAADSGAQGVGVRLRARGRVCWCSPERCRR